MIHFSRPLLEHQVAHVFWTREERAAEFPSRSERGRSREICDVRWMRRGVVDPKSAQTENESSFPSSKDHAGCV